MTMAGTPEGDALRAEIGTKGKVDLDLLDNLAYLPHSGIDRDPYLQEAFKKCGCKALLSPDEYANVENCRVCVSLMSA